MLSWTRSWRPILSVGSVTALYYSNRVMQLPLALFGDRAFLKSRFPRCRLPPSAQVPRRKSKTRLNFALRFTLFMILARHDRTSSFWAGPSCRCFFEYGKIFEPKRPAVTTWATGRFFHRTFWVRGRQNFSRRFLRLSRRPKIPVVVASVCIGLNCGDRCQRRCLPAQKLSLMHPEWAELF